MRKIKLFLAISPDEAGKDLHAIGAFVGELNDRYSTYDIYFHLTAPDDCAENSVEDEAGQSDLFYIVFHTEAHEKALSAFNAAYDSFTRCGQPRIMTYFKQLNNENPSRSILSFMEHLDKELGHYYNYYTNVDTVKLNIVLQLQSLGLVGAELKVKNSVLYMDGSELLSLYDIPIFYKNKQLAALQNEYEELDREYWELKDKQRKNPEDDKLNHSVNEIGAKKKQTEETISELQSNILKIEAFFVKEIGENGITPRMRYARQCIEDGDVGAALATFSLEDIVSRSEQLVEHLETRKKALKAIVQELLVRAGLLVIDVENENRMDDLEKTFEQAVRIEAEGGLNRTATLLYLSLLLELGKYEKAQKLADTCLAYLKGTDTDGIQTMEALNIAGLLSSSTNNKQEAEVLLEQALKIAESRWMTEPDKYAVNYAVYCCNLASLYADTGRSRKAKGLFVKALKVYRELPEKVLAANANYYSSCCISLASQYGHASPHRRERLYREAIEVNDDYIRELTIKYFNLNSELGPGEESILLSLAYKNRAICGTRLAAMRIQSEDYDEAKELLDYSELLWDSLYTDDKEYISVYGSHLAETLYYSAELCKRTNCFDDAEESIIQAFFIFKLLDTQKPGVYDKWLDAIYNSLKTLLENSDDPDYLEEQYNESIKEIGKWLSENDPQTYTRWLAEPASCKQPLSKLLLQPEIRLLGKLDRYRLLAEEQPGKYDEMIAICCYGLAQTYEKSNLNDEAEKCYLETKRLFYQLAEKDALHYNRYINDLSEKLVHFYSGIGREDKAQEAQDEARAILQSGLK